MFHFDSPIRTDLEAEEVNGRKMAWRNEWFRLGPTNRYFEPRLEISNNEVSATSKVSDQPAHTRSLIRVFAGRNEYSINVKLLTGHNLECLSLKGGSIGSSESQTCQNDTLLEITCHGSFSPLVLFVYA